MSTQYDNLGTTYDIMRTIPHDLACSSSNRRILGDVTGLDVLDLACGTGRYSTLFLDWGAASVVGIDISTEMIRAAKETLAKTPERGDRLKYYVGDLSQPSILQTLKLDDRTFDLVHGAWLLNYASTPAELVAMWRNIASALKPGGRFVGLIPNILDRTDLSGSGEEYGVVFETLAEVEGGYKTRVRTFTEPSVEFECYLLNEEGLYERCAREAGMEIVGLERAAPGEKELEEFPEGFWEEYLRRPLGMVCVATRAAER